MGFVPEEETPVYTLIKNPDLRDLLMKRADLNQHKAGTFTTIIDILDLFHDPAKPGSAGVLPDWKYVAGTNEVIMEGWNWKDGLSAESVAYSQFKAWNAETEELELHGATYMKGGWALSMLRLKVARLSLC
jgi:hypothetical protein